MPGASAAALVVVATIMTMVRGIKLSNFFIIRLFDLALEFYSIPL